MNYEEQSKDGTLSQTTNNLKRLGGGGDSLLREKFVLKKTLYTTKIVYVCMFNMYYLIYLIRYT